MTPTPNSPDIDARLPRRILGKVADLIDHEATATQVGRLDDFGKRRA